MAMIFTIIFVSYLRMSFGEFMKACYFLNWAQYRPDNGRFLIENYQPNLCSHIFLAYYEMKDEFTIKSFDFVSTVPTDKLSSFKRIQPNIKLIVTFGGPKYSFYDRTLNEMVSIEQNRKLFIQSVLALIRENNFDGFNFECQFVPDKNSTAIFLRQMKESLSVDGYLFMATISGQQPVNEYYDINALKYLDWIHVACYNFSRPTDEKTGCNNPLLPSINRRLSITTILDMLASEGFPKYKIIVGLSAMSVGWRLKDTSDTRVGAETIGPANPQPVTRESGVGVASYYDICQLLDHGNKSSFQSYDNVQHCWYLVYDNDVWYSTENEKSFRDKFRFITENSYGGVSVWSLDLDDFNGNCSKNNGTKFPLISVLNHFQTHSTVVVGSIKFPDLHMTESHIPEFTSLTLILTTTTSNGAIVVPTDTPGLEFDPNVDCRTNNKHVDDTNCANYYDCIKGQQPLLLSCESNKIFDANTLKCVDGTCSKNKIP